MVLRSYELPRDDFDDSVDDGFEWSAANELASGERICAPLEEPRGSTFWPAALVIAVMLTAAWVFAQFPAATQAIGDSASALIAANTTPTVATAETAAPAPPPPAPVASTEVAAAPGADAGEAVAPVAHTSDTVSEPGVAAAAEQATEAEAGDGASAAPVDPAVIDTAAVSEPLPKPVADPADPNQKRALAAGLHPDVSKALLARMTQADYSNARSAVENALLQPGDDASAWPRDGAKAGAALFEVKFVAGAAPGCRRYVVVITKDRWSTTAPPMEKCGNELPKRKVARNRA